MTSIARHSNSPLALLGIPLIVSATGNAVAQQSQVTPPLACAKHRWFPASIATQSGS